MTHMHILRVLCGFGMLLPTLATAQESYRKTQLLPDSINTISICNYTTLHVRQGNESRFEVNMSSDNFSAIGKTRGKRVSILEDIPELTLYVAPQSDLTIQMEDYATLNLEGDFSPFKSLKIESEDYSQIHILGKYSDTLRTKSLSLTCKDFARLVSDMPVQWQVAYLTAEDFSSINFYATDNLDIPENEDGIGISGEITTVDELATLNLGRHTKHGVLTSADSTYTHRTATTKVPVKKKRRHPWHTTYELAGGWHNWSNSVINGFDGTTGASNISTSFNYFYLAISYPIVNTHRFAITAGLGLEWDKYKFNARDVVFDGTTFQLGSDNFDQSYLKTNYVVVPISLCFGNPRKWHGRLTALPGLHWDGRNTGMRHLMRNSERELMERNFTINHQLNPYKLDLRLDVFYDWIGLYMQIAPISILKKNCDTLYPLRCGVILKID